MKHVRELRRTYHQVHRTGKYSQHSSIFWPAWLNGWLFVYQPSGCGFESICSHLNFRLRACFKQGVPWDSGNYKDSLLNTHLRWQEDTVNWRCRYVLLTQLNYLTSLAKWLSVRLRGCVLESSSSHFNFRYRYRFEKGVLLHSRNYIECGFTLKHIREITSTYSQMQRAYKYSQKDQSFGQFSKMVDCSFTKRVVVCSRLFAVT